MAKVIALYSSDVFATYNFRGSFIRKMISKGHRVVCFLPNIDQDSQAFILDLGAEIVHVTIDRVSMNLFKCPKEVISLYQAIRKVNPQIFLSFFIKPNLISGLVLKVFKNIRFVCIVEGSGSVFSELFPSTRLRRVLQSAIFFIYKFCLSECNKVVFLNSRDVEQFLELNIVTPQQVKFLGAIGVDLDYFKFCRNNIREPVFLMCARIIREKGIVEFIEASKVIASKHSNVQFFLLGALDNHPDAFRRDEFLNLLKGSPVVWVGHTEVLPFLEKSTCFVLPTFYREGSPRSIQEALAASLPVITTNIAGCKELIVDGETGIIVEPRSIGSLVDAMESIIGSPKKAMTMGQNGRRFAETYLDCNVADNVLYNIAVGEDLV